MEIKTAGFLNEKIAPAALGAWVLGGAGKREIFKTIHQAIERGIGVIDTAPLNGFGRTEEAVGRAIKEYGNRDGILLRTKFGLNWKGNQILRHLRAKTVLKEADDSLRPLGVDRIDLYQLHWPDPKTLIPETASALKQPRYSRYLECVAKLKQWVERKYQKTIVDLAIRWVFDKGGIPLHPNPE